MTNGPVGWSLIVVCAVIGRPAAPRAMAQPPGRRETGPPGGSGTVRGVRRLRGRYLTLWTDLPPGEPVDRLPHVFDQAVPQWCDYFGVPLRQAARWRPRAMIMARRSTFRTAGLLPDDLPEFAHGFSRGREIWMDDQPTDYYRRHLLLHEGTHSFMHRLLGGCGPTWYMEGIAELLATHAWRGGRLQLGYFPARRDEVPMLGRIPLVQRAVAEGRRESLRQILAYRSRGATAENEFYAWCWAAATFFDGHPRYRDAFRRMTRHVTEPDFNSTFRRTLGEDWPRIEVRWALFASALQYGHDRTRTAIDFRPGRRVGREGATTTIAADRGWQSSGWRVEAGRPYQLTARGRYQLAARPSVWWCEPGGVTIRYYRGRPLGMLLALVIPEDVQLAGPAGGETGWIAPVPIGLRSELVPRIAGTLYLKINESPGQLGDNSGTLQVALRPK